jgi:hypothetical protein
MHSISGGTNDESHEYQMKDIILDDDYWKKSPFPIHVE